MSANFDERQSGYEAGYAAGRASRDSEVFEAIGNQQLTAFIEKHGKPVPMQQEIDSLKVEVEALKELLAGKFSDVSIQYAGEFFGVTGFIAPLLVEMFAAHFKESHAENYLEMSFKSAQILPSESFIVRVQKLSGKTPHGLRLEAEQQRDEMRKEVEALRAHASTARTYMDGYSDGKAWSIEQAQPVGKSTMLSESQIHQLYKECQREVAKLEADERYTFAAWFPIAVRLVEAAHGISLVAEESM